MGDVKLADTNLADANDGGGSRADARRVAIEEAAYEVLMRDGYKAASILAIAKQAKASNETLYRWYGNKQGLFAALVARNASEARTLLSDALAQGADPLSTLKGLGPVLLSIVTSERAVALNRAAAGDVYDTGILGAALAAGGRDAVVPLIAAVITAARDGGALTVADPSDAADTYVDLLIGDWQIRRCTGAMALPTQAQLSARADRAYHLFVGLCGGSVS
ncbi:MAG: TetR/AcrR family transcriptional regulator [Devosiaceae bacterium]|nr:TetR/AcrR family transcriptional regulator [Devosiaceae bacterium MH13]